MAHFKHTPLQYPSHYRAPSPTRSKCVSSAHPSVPTPDFQSRSNPTHPTDPRLHTDRCTRDGAAIHRPTTLAPHPPRTKGENKDKRNKRTRRASKWMRPAARAWGEAWTRRRGVLESAAAQFHSTLTCRPSSFACSAVASSAAPCSCPHTGISLSFLLALESTGQRIVLR